MMNNLKGILVVTLAVLVFSPCQAIAKDVKWTVKGTVKVTHQISELATKYGATSPLEGVLVKVSAKSKVAGVWGTYAKWDQLRTDKNGKFSFTKDKSSGDRKFKVEIKFDDSKMELRHRTATSSLTKVKWYTARDGVQKSSGTVDFGDITFRSGGANELGDMEPRGHADIWKLMHAVVDRLEDMGSNFEYTTKLKIKFPHDSAVVGQDIPYANPTTKVVYIPEGWLTSDTIIHECGHIWAYNHMKGEICLTETLILDQNTHGLVDDHCVAFGEGSAEYFKDKMEEEIFAKTAQLPYNRAYLANTLNLTNLGLVERHDMGWRSVLHMLSMPNLHKYDFFNVNATGVGSLVADKNIIPRGCTSPNIGFQNVLNVFNENSSKGRSKKLVRAETTILEFLDRAEDILTTKMTPDNRDMFEKLARPQRTEQPSEFLCTGLTKKIGTAEPLGKKKN
jgi:hypothetical protein